MASGLKVEKKPNRCEGLYRGMWSSRDGRLVGAAAAHVQAAADIRRRLYARQQLQAAEEIGFANGRHLLQRLDLQGDKTALGGLLQLFAALGLHHDLFANIYRFGH